MKIRRCESPEGNGHFHFTYEKRRVIFSPGGCASFAVSRTFGLSATERTIDYDEEKVPRFMQPDLSARTALLSTRAARHQPVK